MISPSGIFSRHSWLAAVLAVAATYFYFLIFAEFAFLEIATKVVGSDRVRLVLASLGGGGVLGALLAAWRFSLPSAAVQLTGGFLGCTVAAGLSLMARGPVGLLLAASVAGLSLGWLTVALASVLGAATGGRRLGLCIGLGTGLAYGACNMPTMFRAASETQALWAGAVACFAAFVPRWFALTASSPSVAVNHDRRAITRWIVVLLALVWMDSAAFYIIQHNATLRTATWHSTSGLLANAGLHAIASVIAGLLLDRRQRALVALLALAALGVACILLRGEATSGTWAGPAYAAGVSLYSTLLVEIPARRGLPSAAAATYCLAGWVGSALGIGMAQDLAESPLGFVVAATLAVIGMLAWRRVALRTAAFGLVLLGCTIDPARAAENNSLVAHGREVYIAEGCIHCHSQFVRSKAADDIERWGPATRVTSSLSNQPPLFGTRRQGPDLANVGNRRSPEWNRLHLIAPRAVSPGSRMPSYAHLFSGDATRGDALLAYLASLGADTLEERYTQISAWVPAPTPVTSPAASRSLFLKLCAQCHGTSGHADGPLAPRVSVRPPDWSREPWRRVTPGAPATVDQQIARIVKFGLPGLAMAGHEYLPDADVVGLARHVRSLHNESAGGPPAATQP